MSEKALLYAISTIASVPRAWPDSLASSEYGGWTGCGKNGSRLYG